MQETSSVRINLTSEIPIRAYEWVFSQAWMGISIKYLVIVFSNKNELNNSQQINDALYNFYQTLFKEKLSLSEECVQSFLDKMSLSKPLSVKVL